MNQTDSRQLFDNWAEGYDPAANSSECDFPFAGYDRVLDKVVRLAEVKPGMRILDLGVGTGNLAARFLDANCELWGCDFSIKMLAKAREKWPQLHLLQVDLMGEWPIQLQQPFDRVLAAYVLHHFNLAAKVKLLRQLTVQSLTRGGCILVADISFPTEVLRTAASRRWADRWDSEEYYMAADETIRACDRAGLDVQYRQVSCCAGIYILSP